jgi:hypothetical protein
MGLLLVLLAVLFIGLKLAAIGVVATWSWWLVLLPLWGGLALWLAFLLFAVIIAAIAAALK